MYGSKKYFGPILGTRRNKKRENDWVILKMLIKCKMKTLQGEKKVYLYITKNELTSGIWLHKILRKFCPNYTHKRKPSEDFGGGA